MSQHVGELDGMTCSSNPPQSGRFPFAWLTALAVLAIAVWPGGALQAQGVADLAPPRIGGSPTPQAVPPQPAAPQPTPAHEEIPIPALTPQPQPQPTPAAQPVAQPAAGSADLVVTLPWGTVPPLPTRVLAGVSYLADKDMLRLATAMDPKATQQPNAAQAFFLITIAKEPIYLFTNRKSVQINQTLLEASEPLRVEGGQYYIPLRSVQLILDHYQDVKSNIPELLKQPVPVAQPTPAPLAQPPAVGSLAPENPPVASSAAGTVSTPGLGLAPPPLPDFLQADPRDIAEALLSFMGKDPSNTSMRVGLKPVAAPLVARRFIILDPQTGSSGLPASAGAPPADLTYQIATRCRDLLAQAQTVEVYVTIKSASENPSADQRLASINAVTGKALINLRLDWSPFEENRGYRIFTAHESVDSEGLERSRAAIAATPGAVPPPAAPAYLPYDDMSRVLALLLDLQMKRINRMPPAASNPLQMAPLYLLKRTAMPAVTVSLGYWSNPSDRSYLSTQDYVEQSALALARTIVLYDRWLRQIQEEPGA